ncbi:hypothetical protein ABZX77_05840 [Streptomyces sp. NPDC004237]|uniref:hypothetical protein n=1 Tax=Streptomyces sp. NPDC004237 TaxID=3154455 RepID=UPI0033B9E253
MKPSFTRGFRLHHNGGYLDGAEFPSGRVYVLDDPEVGLATAATSLERLLAGYHGARVEWSGDQLVPTGLLDELLRITTYVSRGQDAVGDGEPYPEAAARAVLSRLTDYLGADVVARAGQPAGADRFVYERDHDAELLLNGLPPEVQESIRAQLAAETAEWRAQPDGR